MTANRSDVPDMTLATSCLLILGPKEGYKSLGNYFPFFQQLFIDLFVKIQSNELIDPK